MTPESVGIPRNRMVLGKHSGRHAFEERLKDLGFQVSPETVEELFAQFKALADKKKVVSDRDIEAMVTGAILNIPETYKLDRWVVNSGSAMSATSTVRLQTKDGAYLEQVAVGDGPIEAAFKAINAIIGKQLDLENFEVGAVTSGEDAQGEATVKIGYEGRHWNGRGISTDVVEASIKAYIAAINNMEWELSATDRMRSVNTGENIGV
jgi:2-isopropylmalate synthase